MRRKGKEGEGGGGEDKKRKRYAMVCEYNNIILVYMGETVRTKSFIKNQSIIS